MTSSNSYSWSLDNAGVVTEAFARCGIHPTALTREHFFSATRSLNLALSAWSNRGVNLWQVDLQSIPLSQGVPVYNLPSTTVNILDAYLETYSLQTTVGGSPDFSTVNGSAVVTVGIVAHGLVANNWINIIMPTAIGGIILFGLYQVTTVLNANQFTITAAANAASPISNAGALPTFTTFAGDGTITVGLENHGYEVGNTFIVQEATSVGGLLLTGPYIVATVPTSGTFTLEYGDTALANDSQYENYGVQIIMTQLNSNNPIDRVLTSISRTDYSAQPNKLQQGEPTVFWFDRLTPIPTVTMWYVPDNNGPYVFFYYRMRRIQDAAVQSGQTPDVPYRFLEALCAELAVRLARKYAASLVPALQLDAKTSWDEAAQEDRERVQMFVCPDVSGYYR